MDSVSLPPFLHHEENDRPEGDAVIAEHFQRVSFDIGEKRRNHGPGHQKGNHQANDQGQEILGVEEMVGLHEFGSR